MRHLRHSVTSAVLAAAASLAFAAGAAHAQTTASYFLINFNDGTPSNSFLFQYDFTGTSTTEIAQINALTAGAPGFTSVVNADPSFGDYVVSFGYGGHSEYNDFESSSPLNQPGYWGSFISSDGINWNYSNFGPDLQPVAASTASLYNAWVWEPQVNGVYSNFTPSALPSKISFDVSAASAPEPCSIGFALVGGIVMRRRRLRPSRG